MGNKPKNALLEENPVVSQKDLEIKLRKLESYIQKAQTRIKTHERSIDRLRKAIKKDLGRVSEKVKEIKNIKVSV